MRAFKWGVNVNSAQVKEQTEKPEKKVMTMTKTYVLNSFYFFRQQSNVKKN